MMTHLAFAIRHEVEHLIAMQIETLGKPSSFFIGSRRIPVAIEKDPSLVPPTGPNVAKAISLRSSKSVLSRIEGDKPPFPGGNPVERRLVIATRSRPVRLRILPPLCLFASARLSSAPRTLPVLSLRF